MPTPSACTILAQARSRRTSLALESGPRWELFRMDTIRQSVITNNFADGWRQDAINLFLGRHIVRTKDGARTGSAYVVRNSRFRALPMILLVGLSMFVLSLLVPTPEGSLKLAYVAFWAVALLLTWRTVLYYGTDFVDMPRLAVHPSRHSAGK
eukprot:Opistho-2@4983